MVAGCSRDDIAGTEKTARVQQALEEEREFAVSLPEGVGLPDIAISAAEYVRLHDRVHVVSAGDGFGSLANTGSVESHFGVDSRAGNVASVGAVRLHQQARVEGFVRSAGDILLDTGATVTGSVEQNTTITTRQVSWKVTLPAATSAVTAFPGQSIPVEPGSYTSLIVYPSAQATLTGPGTYAVDTLHLDTNSTLNLDTSEGPIFLHVRTSIIYRGAVTGGDAGSFFIGYLGAQPVVIEQSLRSTLVAPDSPVRLGIGPVPHFGSVYAKRVEVDPDVVFQQVPFRYWGVLTGPGECAQLIPPPGGTGREENIRYQELINRFCAIPGADDCTSRIVARINVDLADVAFALVGEAITPAQFLAVVRDRSRKRDALEDDSALAQLLCTAGDSDGDLVPDGVDECPNTPPLTPTFDNGCLDPSLPDAPSAEDVGTLFENGGFLVDPRCAGAETFPRSVAGGFYYPGIPANGTFVLGRRVTNQPSGCPLWYFFDVEEFDLAGPLKRYMVAFRDDEETTALVGLAKPVPGGFIQFNPLPTDDGTRGMLASAGSPNHRVRFRMRVMNGGGMRSAWSDWKLTDQNDCSQLGFNCPPRDIPPRQP